MALLFFCGEEGVSDDQVGKQTGERGEREDNILLDADKKLLVVAFAGRGITENGLKTCLDDRLEAVESTFLPCGCGSEKGVYGFGDAFSWLCDITVLANGTHLRRA